MNTLTIIVIALFLVFMILGCKRGLFRSVFRIILTGFSFVLAYFCAPMVCSILINNTTIDDYLKEKIGIYIENKAEEGINKQIDKVREDTDFNIEEPTRNEQIDFIYKMQLPDFLTKALMENNNDKMKNALGAKDFFDYIASYITYMIMNALSFAILSLVFWIISNVLFFAIAFVSKLPIISSINRIGGLLFGGLEALLIVWTMFVCISVFVHTEIGARLYSEILSSDLLLFLYNNNAFMSIITGINQITKIG